VESLNILAKSVRTRLFEDGPGNIHAVWLKLVSGGFVVPQGRVADLSTKAVDFYHFWFPYSGFWTNGRVVAENCRRINWL